MKTELREFQIFVKPVGAVCNLSCKYCYYLDKKNLYHDNDPFLMSDDILEIYIRQHIEATTDSIINFSWHGGEPLLAGIDFFRTVIRFQQKYQPAGSKIINGIQTNGTLLDMEWCDFLANEGFIVGISIDGPEDLHNKYRCTGDGRDTFQHTIKGYELLRKSGILPEVLCVVNADNVKYPVPVYDFFKNMGAKYITFLPLVEPVSDPSKVVSDISVPAEEFGFFLSAVFDEWVRKDIGKIKVQIFEEAARTAFNQEHTLCIFKEICGAVPVIEHTGDFYSCDHFVDRDHLLGNIRDHSVSYYLDCENQKAFGQAKSDTLPAYCIDCNVRSMCNGECPKNRFICAPDGELGLNYLCSGYKYFFNHCQPFVEAIGIAWKRKNQISI